MNNLLILVVEDDAPVRNLIGTTLKTHDYDYITATNGESAVMQASSHNPTLFCSIWAYLISTAWTLSEKYAPGRKCLLS